MNNYKDLEDANKAIEETKVDLHNADNTSNKQEEKLEVNNEEKNEPEGSGIFTVDGKELPKVEGGYDIIEPGGSLGDDSFVSI